MSKLLKSIRRTLTSTKDQETEGTKSIIGTILVLLAGVVLYADKIVDYWDIPISYDFEYYNNAEVFIWVVSATVSPLLLISGYWLKPYKWALASPLAAYSVQMMYIWRDENWIQKDFFWWHTIAFMVVFYLAILLIKEISKRRSKQEYITIIHNLFNFIGSETEKEGYVKTELKEKFAKRRIELVDEVVGND